MVEITRASAIGCGVIGAGWVARLRLSGVDVAVFDPSPTVADVLGEVHANAMLAWADLDLAPAPGDVGAITFHESSGDALARAHLG
jgi:carnitine 3-dehydrogenase